MPKGHIFLVVAKKKLTNPCKLEEIKLILQLFDGIHSLSDYL